MGRPGSVLFACTMNAVRSPMAAAILRHLLGRSVYVESAGVRAGTLDPLAVEAMDEIGIEIAAHKPRRFEDLEDSNFDLVITLSPEAQHKAVDLTRTHATDVEYWATMDPTAFEGSRGGIYRGAEGRHRPLRSHGRKRLSPSWLRRMLSTRSKDAA